MRATILPGFMTLALLAGAAQAQVPSPGMGQPQVDPTAEAFVTGAGTGLRASKLRGVSVIDLDFKRVGDIKDVLIGKDGTVSAVVVGVGGVLGIGERDVAIRFDRFLWNTGDSAQTTSATSTMRPSEAPPLGDPTANAQSMPGSEISREVLRSEVGASPVDARTGPVATGSTATATAIVGDGAPERAQVRLTRAQLDQAPEFRDEARR
jgi:sporulation protein YlmC with PRC-barrel domain